MKIDSKKIIMVLTIAFIIVLSTMSYASQGSFSVSKSSVTLTEGETTTFSINVSNCEGKFSISSSNSSIAKVSTSSEWISDSKSVTITAVKSGTATITVTASDVGDTSENTVTGSKTISVTVKAKSSGGSSGSGNTSSGENNNTGNNNSSNNNNNNNTTTTKPTFTSVNKTVYTTGDVNLRASWSTSSAATQVEKGTELKLTGTSSQKVNGYTWYRVEYKGATKYVASSLVTSTKPKEDDEDEKEDDKKSDNNNLSSLVIEGVTLSPEFNKDVLQYTAQVDLDVTKLELEAKAENSKATVKIEGNEELKEGENNIKITVTAEDKTTKTYTIKVTKGEILPQEPDNNGDDNALKLSELKILGVNFENGFDPDKYTYELTLNLAVNDLSITAVANQADAKVEILGNENFKEGENLVTIMLTSQDGTQTATYQIKVTMPADATNAQNDLQFYLICGGSAVIAIIAIGVIIAIYKRRNKEEDFEEEETIEYKEETEEPLFSKREEKPLFFEENDKIEKETKVEEKVTLDQFLDTSELEEEEKPRRSKGKHSM